MIGTTQPAITCNDGVRQENGRTLTRIVTVQPGMCGHNELLIARIGDWTWESVGILCGLDVFSATDEVGQPTYLSFAYYQVLGGDLFHLRTPSFGDRLQIVSTCYKLGAESILTLHRLADADRELPCHLSLEELLERRLPDCLYVQNVNRWIRRAAAGNSELVPASPTGFRAAGLPAVSPHLSPRIVYDAARRHGAFPDGKAFRPLDQWTLHYELNPARDFNGVGLLCFASYFAIIDSMLAKVWRLLGRTSQSFLRRAALDSRICFLGNADVDAILEVLIGHAGQDLVERFDIRLLEVGSGRCLAVAAMDFRVHHDRH